jgi:hypothetical protein
MVEEFLIFMKLEFLELFSDLDFHMFFLSPMFCFKTGTQTQGYIDQTKGHLHVQL